MIEAPISRQRQTIFLLLSCLLNLLLVLFLALHHIHIPDRATLITLIDTQSKTIPDQNHHTPWAARKARSGPLGAPVIMQNPTPQPATHQTSILAPQQTTATPYTSSAQPEPIHQSEEKQQNKEETSAQEPAHTKTHTQPIPEVQKEAPLEHYKTTLDHTYTQHKTSETTSTDQQKNPSAPRQKQSAAPTTQSLAKQMTLADLTRRFLDHSADADGTSTVSIIGDKSKLPTEDQLKHERYIEKLTACIHNSCSMNRHKQPHMENVGGSLEIFMALNQNGSIQTVELIRSSGSHHIDAFFMHVFKDAASSFPPVPHYLPHNPYKIAYLIELRTESQSGLRLYRR
jgi:outer membrane biosynthesis protein TonB